MSKLPFLCIVLLTASMSVSAETYTVIHDFGSVAGDPDGPCTPRNDRPESWRRNADHYARFYQKSFWARRSGYGPAVPSRSCINLTAAAWSGLILATDGKFYGTTRASGTFGLGRSSRCLRRGASPSSMTSQEDPTVQTPTAAPIQSVKGDFYGTTSEASPEFWTYGTVYRITKYGNFTLLHAFTRHRWSESKRRQLVQGTDYYFYGTTRTGGAG